MSKKTLPNAAQLLGRSALAAARKAAVTYVRNNQIEPPDVSKLDEEIVLRVRAVFTDARVDALAAQLMGQEAGVAAQGFFRKCAQAGVDAAKTFYADCEWRTAG